MGYSLPSNTDWVTCSWQCHRDRNPPSGEPGTDYGSSYGTPLYAPATGTVVDLKTSNSDATGRYLTIDADDGRRLRSLHLSEIWVGVGQRVSQGQQVGLTGASGFGSDWGYGSHVHQTLWSTHAYNFCSSCTMDFALYVGSVEPGPTQRVVGPGGANGRIDPSTNHPPTQTLPPGTLANMDGWIYGQEVEGNNVWFRGAVGDVDYFWSGGFTDTGTHDLADLNPVEPPPGDTTRQVLSHASANVRALPHTTSPVIGSSDAGTNVEMKAWTHAEEVDGIDIWFQRAADSNWSWAGGFTSQSTDNLTQVPDPGEPQPVDPDNPRGLPAELGYVWPFADQALDAPLGHADCTEPDGPYAPRTMAGEYEVEAIIDVYMIHWTGGSADQMDYFSWCNDRSSCPTTYMRRDGWQSQMIRPGAKPASTGPDWNYRTFAVETLAGPGEDFTEEQWEAHAQNIAYLRSLDGKLLDGIPVDFKIDRLHVMGHTEACDGCTECPGATQLALFDDLVARSQAIYDELYAEPEECPECPECPDPSEPIDYDRIIQGVNDEAAVRRAGWT